VLKDILVPINREGWPFIGIFAAVTAILFMFAEPLGWIGVVLTAWCVYFFRDPDRVTPLGDDLIISPADGVVQLIDTAAPPSELGMGDTPLRRVCIFMNVFNVHVNRVPANGTITATAYRPGKFLNASLDKASEFNERQSVRMTMSGGKELAFVQIAGLVARRIVCYIQEGETVLGGARFGLIRFGSRVDVYLPEGAVPQVALGQQAVAGETVIADLSATTPERRGEVR